MGIADRIKELVSQKHITLAELERKVNISNGQIRKWNDRSPKVDNLEKVAKYFNVSVDYLLGRTDDKHLSKKEQDEKDLQEFLKDNMEHGMTYADHALTAEEEGTLESGTHPDLLEVP
ncbi:MAG: helix-turn-helix domain-containing protein [Candidatus Paralactobacillus gallistercoris]|uniref:Helix-turn-helix domain-containing protein n=1 Tax=Candidatus Paralactobacillus gallistercoris TaxID=2838724 RepID=A0A948X2K9_9LACO|nr:helix-turn-helix domain-containing protein [Candidatus Paralactobacillus gallistercoris]